MDKFVNKWEIVCLTKMQCVLRQVSAEAEKFSAARNELQGAKIRRYEED
jgi:hypothetical protein